MPGTHVGQLGGYSHLKQLSRVPLQTQLSVGSAYVVVRVAWIEHSVGVTRLFIVGPGTAAWHGHRRLIKRIINKMIVNIIPTALFVLVST
jgi:hypothetical protein